MLISEAGINQKKDCLIQTILYSRYVYSDLIIISQSYNYDEIIENLTPYTNLKIWCIDELLEGMN